MRARVSRPFLALTPLQSLIARRWRPEWVCHRCQHQQQWQRQTYRRGLSTATKAVEKPYYITTPIFYVNAAPHVGHMYTMILTDVLKRWQVLHGRQAILATGTDEHGMKIQQAAAKAGVPPKDFCDRGAAVFEDLAKKINISNDVFVRTTDQRHKEGVEYAWQMLQEKGWIYESKHEGWYSVSDETFYPQGQVQVIVDPPTGRKIMVSIETGKEVEWTSERNYHFRLSAFRDRLLEFYAKTPDFVVPKSRMDDIIAEVTNGLHDLSVSRPVDRLTWGIRVPTDPSQTIYVWLDALLNYATSAGYPFSTPGLESQGGWPADVHVVGKDIMRFHCIYWPAFLLALNLPLPKQVLTHAHWTLGRQKMAKSTGNVVDPFFALERFGVEVMRWYLVQEGGIEQDADYDNRFVIVQYKKGLQGGLGNLASRILRGKGWDVQKAVTMFAHPSLILQDTEAAVDTHEPAESDAEDEQASNRLPPAFQSAYYPTRLLYIRMRALPAKVDNHMKNLHPNKALKTIMSAVYDCNGFLQQTSPWTLVTQLQNIMADTTGQSMHELSASKNGPQTPEELEAEILRTVYLCAETLRLVGIMLQPFMPEKSKQLLDMLGVDEGRRDWKWCGVGMDDGYGVSKVELGRGEEGVLFPRLGSAF